MRVVKAHIRYAECIDTAKMQGYQPAMALKRERPPSTVTERANRSKRLRATDIPTGAIDPRLERFLTQPRDWRNLRRLLCSRSRVLPQDQRDITRGGPSVSLEPIQLHLYAFGEA